MPDLEVLIDTTDQEIFKPKEKEETHSQDAGDKG